jgi:hypothetical protein
MNDKKKRKRKSNQTIDVILTKEAIYETISGSPRPSRYA